MEKIVDLFIKKLNFFVAFHQQKKFALYLTYYILHIMQIQNSKGIKHILTPKSPIISTFLSIFREITISLLILDFKNLILLKLIKFKNYFSYPFSAVNSSDFHMASFYWKTWFGTDWQASPKACVQQVRVASKRKRLFI